MPKISKKPVDSQTEEAPSDYSADSIKVLKGLNAVRQRPGMYIGGKDSGGYHHCLWEIIDNSIDEALSGHATQVYVTLHGDGSITVFDDGRGIPWKPHASNKKLSTLEVVFTELHSGGKFDDRKGYKYAGGLHGVGVSVANAMSEWLEVTVRRDGATKGVRFQPEGSGEAFMPGVSGGLKDVKVDDSYPKTFTEITFKLDNSLFTDVDGFELARIRDRMAASSYLNPGIEFTLVDEDTGDQWDWISENGIMDLIDDEAADAGWGISYAMEAHGPVLISSGDKEFKTSSGAVITAAIDVAIGWYDMSGSHTISFANSIPTPSGGTHLNGVKNGIKNAVNRFAVEYGLIGEGEVISLPESHTGVIAVVSGKISDPDFKGQTKEELSNPELSTLGKETVEAELYAWFVSNKDAAYELLAPAVEKMQNRIASAEDKEDLTARKDILSAAKATKLNDCQSKDPSQCEIFIVEGDSAGGTAVAARDYKTQALLPLKGKPKNTWPASYKGKSALNLYLNNSEIRSIIASVGTGSGEGTFDYSKLRYDKIIILADADDDGHHIALLLEGFFMRWLPELVLKGHLYRVAPPLFVVTTSDNKKHYIQDDDELTAFSESNKVVSVTRLKGLGEMNAEELAEVALNRTTRRLKRLVMDPEEIEIAMERMGVMLDNDAEAKGDLLSEVSD